MIRSTFSVQQASYGMQWVAIQWQHSATTVSLYPLINAQHKAARTASTVFQVFVTAQSGIEHILRAFVACDQPFAPLR